MDESLGSGTCQSVVGMRASVNHGSFSHTVILRNPLSRAVFPCSGRVFHPLDREKTHIFVVARKNSLCQIFASVWSGNRISIGKFNAIKQLQTSTQNTSIPRQLNSDGIKADRFKAGWDNDYLARVLFSE